MAHHLFSRQILLPSSLALWLQPVFQRGWYSPVLSLMHLIHPPHSQLLSLLDASRLTHLKESFSESSWGAKRQTPLPVNHSAVCLAGNNGTLPTKPLFQIMLVFCWRPRNQSTSQSCAVLQVFSAAEMPQYAPVDWAGMETWFINNSIKVRAGWSWPA